MKLNKKNKLLVVGFFLSLYICYAYAFSNTFYYYRQYHKNIDLDENAINNALTIHEFKFKEKQLDKLLLESNSAADKSFQNKLLKEVTSLSAAHQLQILEFDEPYVYNDKNSKTYSYSIKLQGNFNNTLRLINAIENKLSLGKVLNVNFIKLRNHKTNTDYLTCSIILQRSESINNKAK